MSLTERKEMVMAVKISPLVHIEIVVRDAEEAYRFLKRVFGAEKTQLKFAGMLDGPGAHVVHVELGRTILQFIEPRQEGTLWWDFLKEKGPGVHNLTFTVENMEETVKALEKEGAEVLLKFPLDWSYMAEILPPGINIEENPQPVHMIEAMEKVGFRIELGEARPGEDGSLPDLKDIN